MTRGRKLGVKVGPTVGSRPWTLLRLAPGERAFLPAPPGRLLPFMQQVSSDIQRNGLKGLVTQTRCIGVVPDTREVIDIVIVQRKE